MPSSDESKSDSAAAAAVVDSSSDRLCTDKGTVVRVDGLQSELGQRMNGKLAEVLNVDQGTGRIRVILAVDRKIMTAAVKAENLTVHLTEQDAIQMTVGFEEKYQGLIHDYDWSEYIRQSNEMNDRLPNMSPGDIVRGIRENDWALLQAFNLPEDEHPHKLDESTILEVFEQGLIEACLDKFPFPEAIDDDTDDKRLKVFGFAPETLDRLLGSLHTEGGDKSAFDRWNREMVQQLGPVIMTACTPKRRLYNSTDVWHFFQCPFLRLLHNCVSTGGASRIEFLLNSMDAVVLKTMAQHLATCMMVDLSVFLSRNSVLQMDHPHVEKNSLRVKLFALVVVVELVSISNFEGFATLVGQSVAPDEVVGMAGRHFGECFLDCAATYTALKELPEYEKGDVVFNLRYIYQQFFDCRKLRPILGVFDREFFSLKSNTDFERWAEARLDGMH